MGPGPPGRPWAGKRRIWPSNYFRSLTEIIWLVWTIYPSIHLSIYLSTYSSTCLSVCLSIFALMLHIYIYISIQLNIYIYIFICIYIYIYIWQDGFELRAYRKAESYTCMLGDRTAKKRHISSSILSFRLRSQPSDGFFSRFRYDSANWILMQICKGPFVALVLELIDHRRHQCPRAAHSTAMKHNKQNRLPIDCPSCTYVQP